MNRSPLVADLPSMASVAKAMLVKSPALSTSDYIDQLVKIGYNRDDLLHKHRASKSLTDTRLRLQSKGTIKKVAQSASKPTSNRKQFITPSGKFSVQGWLRNQILHSPLLTPEALQEAYRKAGHPKDSVPTKQWVYVARTAIKKRWGVEFADTPRTPQGKLNISGLVRLFLDRNGNDATEAEAIRYFETDGITLGPGQFANAKSTYMKGLREPKAAVDGTIIPESPMRRARFVRNKRSKKAEPIDSMDRTSIYLTLEKEIEQIIRRAEDLRDHDLTKALLNSRRYASAGAIR